MRPRGPWPPAAAALLVLGTLTACTWTPPEASCALPSSAPTAAATEGPAPDGKSVKVVQQGYSIAPNNEVLMGAILANTSTFIAYRTRIRFRPLDAQHRPEAPSSEPAMAFQEIPVVLPGQRIGVGARQLVTRNDAGAPMRVTSFEIEIGPIHWLPPEALPGYRPVTAALVRVERPRPMQPYYRTFTYDEKSTNCTDLTDRGAGIVLRNGHGTIIGGTHPLTMGSNAGRTCWQGSSQQTAQPLHEIRVPFDEARTEIYPYCDVDRPPHMGGSVAPFN
ncbi:hypothetical protein [Rhizomonospora bruguierae]|uniref:hypothetical protein n=1 Tax=Rhizomonospora bruguierae TaxID=1581705 RepID=UPI001BD03CB2|nr:hypothetical protein [Micromonospora sp. NBRC 107566]